PARRGSRRAGPAGGCAPADHAGGAAARPRAGNARRLRDGSPSRAPAARPGPRRGRLRADVGFDSRSTRRLDGPSPPRYAHDGMIAQRPETITVAPGLALEAALAL